jgi:hypothetical protein
VFAIVRNLQQAIEFSTRRKAGVIELMRNCMFEIAENRRG